MQRVLDGQYIPGACFVALDRMATAFNSAPQASIDKADAMVAQIALGHDSQEALRTWWHSERGGLHSWISVNPGEYRTDPPPEPCRIIELSETSPYLPRRSLLSEAAALCAQTGWITGHEENTLRRAQSVISRTSEAPIEMLAKIRSAQGVRDRESYQDLVNELYARYFETLACNTSSFTLAVALMQLQAFAGAWIDRDWASRPADFLPAYVTELLRDKTQTSRMFEMCEIEYDQGHVHTQRALAGSMRDMPRELNLAWHHFLGALVVARAALDAGLERQSLPINFTILDEAAACAHAGLHRGAHFFLADPESEARSWMDDSGYSAKWASRKARAASDEIWPAFTRHFAEIIGAQALTLTGGEQTIREGKDRLLQLLEADDANGEFETAWIEQALLKAHIALAEEAEIEAMARRIAGKITVRFALSHRPE